MPAVTQYLAPRSLEEATRALADGGVSMFAGGTDLMVQTETVTKRLAPRPIAPAVAESAPADPAEALAQKASDLLRQAEGEMHNGRNAEAKALLDEAAPMIANLKEVAPNHRRMMALETALARQSEVVDKRLAPPDRSQVPVAATATTPVGNAPLNLTSIVFGVRCRSV